jgi:flagella synthesis protein FlgN
MTIAHPRTTLAGEQKLLATLVDLLKQEQGLLVAADADGLAALTPQKSELVQQLALQSAERHRALGEGGFEAGEAGMEPWLAASGDQEARAAWEQLLELTREAKELNRLNGMLINKHLAHNQQVLGALRTQGTGGEAAVYGPGGQTVGGGPSKRFVVG